MRRSGAYLLILLTAACGSPSAPDGHVAPPPPVDMAGADLVAQSVAGGTLRIVALDDETGLAMPARAILTGGGSGKPCDHMDDLNVDPKCAPSERCSNGAHTDQPPRCVARFDLDGKGMPVKGEYGLPVSPGVIGAPEGVLLVAGDGSLRVPPGDYDVFVTRGPEWEAVEQHVTVTAGAGATVVASLRRSVDTTGWMAADMHVHTRRSYDSKLQESDRVVSEVAVGVEIIVSTDHNVITDLQPDVDTLGYTSLARAIVGNEFNFLEGHGGVYPMPYDPTSPDGGATAMSLDWNSVKGIPGVMMFPQLHALATHPAVTVNHPRLPPDLGYFLNMHWAPPQPLDGAGLFDGLEILNGYMDAPTDRAALLRDWFFLVSSGYRVTALGNSDTHRLRDVKAGFPRTWLAMPTEDPAAVTPDDLSAAIKGGRAVASNGPFAQLAVDGKGIGALVVPTGSTLAVEVTVDAPAWIDVDKVRLIVDGAVAMELPVPPGKRPRFHQTLTLPVPSGDGWVALEATGTRPLPTALIGEHQDGAVTPFVITNPVFLDVDGDGKWQPQIANPDPGPLGPQSSSGPDGWYHHEGDPVPEDCEPPLWTDPSTWVNP